MTRARHDSFHAAGPLSEQRGLVLRCALWTGRAGVCLAFSTRGWLKAWYASYCKPKACSALQAHDELFSCMADCSFLEGVHSDAASL